MDFLMAGLTHNVGIDESIGKYFNQAMHLLLFDLRKIVQIRFPLGYHDEIILGYFLKSKVRSFIGPPFFVNFYGNRSPVHCNVFQAQGGATELFYVTKFKKGEVFI